MPFNRLQDLSDSEFESKVVHSARVVIIDFWAPWCEPCKLLDPILERLAARFEGSVDFLKMNVDEEPETPAEFAVRSIPTMLFFKQGTLANQIIGVESEENIEAAIERLL